MKNTLVSCFLSNTNARKDRDINKYLEYGLKLLNTNIKKIIFIEEHIIDLLINNYGYEKNKYTNIIPLKREDLYLNAYKDKITNFNILTTFSDKDTLDYMILICNKTEFIKRAILINTFKTENFVWVDFGINHIFKCSDILFQEKLKELENKEYDKVRIGSILLPGQISKNIDIYRNVLWYFAGGVFGGNKDALLEFAELTKCKCLEIIKQKRTIIWEVNVWYLVFLENEDLFSPYYCNHDERLITDY